MENTFLIVGLGNPGAEYARTRHNAGFLLVEELAKRWQAGWGFEKKFQARIAKSDRDGRRLLLCQPQTYMNLSGEAVSAVAGFHKVPAARVLVAVDDADLPMGQLRLRSDGSSGGHHGLESVEAHLGTRAYPRLRIGIGRLDAAGRDIAGHVLGRMTDAEWEVLVKVLHRACDQAECWTRDGIAQAMNRFNGAAIRPEHNKETL
jgi:PTH1 family peptidyl-tRNA hydrolase